MCCCMGCRSAGILYQSCNKNLFSLSQRKLSIDLKRCLFILHPQFTLNSLAHFTGGLHKTKCQFQDTQKNVNAYSVPLQLHKQPHTHTQTVVGGKGNPLCVFLHSSYEYVSDIQLISSSTLLDSSLSETKTSEASILKMTDFGLIPKLSCEL